MQAGRRRKSSGQLGAPEAAPHMQEQMAQRESITSRVPQKYLVQNQSGLRVYYWVDKVNSVNPGPYILGVLNPTVAPYAEVTGAEAVLCAVNGMTLQVLKPSTTG